MVALFVSALIPLTDPVAVVQLQYPARRTTVTTGSGYMVYYTLSGNAPAELWRAYKLLELAEREVLIAEALQLFRAEMVANERRLEGLRTARAAAYLAGDIGVQPQLLYVDPALAALPESTLKSEVGRGLAREARIERAIAAVDRLADAHYQLRQVLVSLAYPDAATRPVVSRPGWIGPAPAASVPTARQRVAPVARVPSAPTSGLDAAERAEKAAADTELRAEARERTAREVARDAEERYRLADAEERADARTDWLAARAEWEKARREWDAAREKWQTTRDAVAAARKKAGLAPETKTTAPTNTAVRPR
jgi:hypothetical protein